MDNGACSYRRYLDGDETAFEQIVKDYRDPLVFFIFGIVKDYHAAEDIAIDVFAYLAADRRFNFKVSLKTYLFTVGRSRAIDYIRRRKRREALDISVAEPYLSETTFEEDFLADLRKKELHRAIATLPERMRTAVYLVYFEDLSYKETAKIMKLSKKQVDNLLYRAKADLRSIITEKGNII